MTVRMVTAHPAGRFGQDEQDEQDSCSVVCKTTATRVRISCQSCESCLNSRQAEQLLRMCSNSCLTPPAVAATPALRHGGACCWMKVPTKKAGAKSTGVGRQHNGRLGKIEMSQVGVFLAFNKDHVWTWVGAGRPCGGTPFRPEFIRRAPSPRIHSAARRETMACCTGWVVTSAKPSPTNMLISLRTPKSAR